MLPREGEVTLGDPVPRQDQALLSLCPTALGARCRASSLRARPRESQGRGPRCFVSVSPQTSKGISSDYRCSVQTAPLASWDADV